MRRSVARGAALVLLLLLALHAPSAWAQVVIYRCTDASGAVTLQNGTPCPKGSRQQKRVMDTPPPAPAPIAPAPAPAPPAAAPVTPTAIAPVAPVADPAAAASPVPKQPPPALYECRTWDRQRYFGEVAQPPPRCVPVQVTGLDGQAGSAGGVACQMMEDQCQPVPDARLCEAWAERLREMESRSTFGDATAVEPQGDAAQVRAIVQGSTCE